MLSYLPDLFSIEHIFMSRLSVMRTFHYYLHVVDQAINHIESLGNGQLGLLEGQSIQTLKNGVNAVLPQ